MKTIVEPFRVKVVEQIKMTTRDEREGYLTEAAYNLRATLQPRFEPIDGLTIPGSGVKDNV